MSLSDRLRPNVEAAPWVIVEVEQLEEELQRLRDSTSDDQTAVCAVWKQTRHNCVEFMSVVGISDTWQRRAEAAESQLAIKDKEIDRLNTLLQRIQTQPRSTPYDLNDPTRPTPKR